MKTNFDFIIIGVCIIGLIIAREFKTSMTQSSILIIDKEDYVAKHSSCRNSGVLHAGFYYTADSLKAKFTVAGNKAMKDLVHNIDVSKFNEWPKPGNRAQ